MASTSRRIEDIIDPKTGFVRGTNRYIGGIVTSHGGMLARAQKKSNNGQDAQILDESLDNFKKPNSDLDVKQKICKAGETVPIVFGKRVNNIGGIWIQPNLIKAGTESFVQKLLYVISQGDIAGTPSKATTYTGLNKLTFLDNASSITLTNIYNSPATLAASPTTCPINGTGLFCGNDIYTFLNPVVKSSGSSLERGIDLAADFAGFKDLTIGSGDTSNTTFLATFQVFDSETGTNVTTAYFNAIGLPSTTEFRFNARFDSNFNIIGGRTVGTVDTTFAALEPPLTGSALSSVLQVSGGRTLFTFKWTVTSLDNQTNTSNPATTGTLEGIQQEVTISNNSTLQNSSNNNSSFADITFLATSGTLYQEPSSGTFPTTTKQLYIFYDQGVKVDLYSAGLSGSNYTNAASNQFIDLAMYLFKIYKKVDGTNTADIVAPVKISNLQSLSSFCSNNNMFFNGIVSKSVNIVEFISTFAPYYFLAFLSVGGRYEFAPLLPINNSNQIDTTAITPVVTFTETNIIPGSFKKDFFSVEDRRNFIANCIYTQCTPTDVARRKTVSVKLTATDLDSPTEQFDMSDCCEDVNHAILYAKYELARRKHSTHNISFATTLLTTSVIPTNIIKVQLQRKNSVGDDRTEIEYYQITSITYDNNGVSNVEATHFPLNTSNIAVISNEVTSGSFTILQ